LTGEWRKVLIEGMRGSAGVQIEQDWTDGYVVDIGRLETHMKFLLEKRSGRHHLESLNVDERIILKRILKRGSGLNLRGSGYGTVEGSDEHK
jgi:hypothetical protein